MQNKKLPYIVIAILVLVIFTMGAYTFDASNQLPPTTEVVTEKENGPEEEHEKVNYNKPVAETHNDYHDFGVISKTNGIVSTTFEIENHGKAPLIIGEISTSCGCTSAEIAKTELGFNEETDLTVFFDPDFHEEPDGKFERSVFVPTNDPDLPEMQFDISVEIVE